jgi:His-Xaa-Ser system protein HxsD
MNHTNFVKEGEIAAFAETTLFTKEAIFKCLYWYGDKFHTTVSLVDSETYLISLKTLSNANIKGEELETYLQKLERDLVDYQLREMIIKETQNVRDLLVAKAFSNGEFDEHPPGDISDPVGFSPLNQYEE